MPSLSLAAKTLSLAAIVGGETVAIYGNARVTEGAAVPLLQRLAPIYLGPKADYPPASMRNIAGYVTRITPARFSGIGPWVQQAAG